MGNCGLHLFLLGVGKRTLSDVLAGLSGAARQGNFPSILTLFCTDRQFALIAVQNLMRWFERSPALR
jgi:hypothetical protein